MPPALHPTTPCACTSGPSTAPLFGTPPSAPARSTCPLKYTQTNFPSRYTTIRSGSCVPARMIHWQIGRMTPAIFRVYALRQVQANPSLRTAPTAACTSLAMQDRSKRSYRCPATSSPTASPTTTGRRCCCRITERLFRHEGAGVAAAEMRLTRVQFQPFYRPTPGGAFVAWYRAWRGTHVTCDM